MSGAHREILHLARLLARIAEDLPTGKIDRYLIRDAQRVIEAIETLARMHTAQEEDIYEAAAAQGGGLADDPHAAHIDQRPGYSSHRFNRVVESAQCGSA